MVTILVIPQSTMTTTMVTTMMATMGVAMEAASTEKSVILYNNLATFIILSLIYNEFIL